MLGSISSLGERARGRRWETTASALALGAVGSGALLGGTLGSLGALLPLGAATRAWTELAVITAAVLVDTAWLPRRIGPIRQVNDHWLQIYRGWIAGSGFGIQLGLAVATVVTSATTYVVLVSMLLVGNVWIGVVIGAAYGGVRALTSVLGGAIRRPEQLVLADRLLSHTDGMARMSVVAVTAGWALGAFLLWKGG